ncbi:MAG: prolyl oligopeptidase family serine peptidase [Clostridia bacterium]|nr:prolyl oligopeptidase family serine peptidase [Clostridia bacterium]
MNKIITFENLSTFCYCNYNLCKTPIRGIVLSFRGLGSMKAFTDDSPEVADDAKLYGEQGILYVKPSTNPWSWMNRQAVAVTDEIVDVLFEHFDLPADTPIVSTGGSMGGQQALVYMLYAKRTPIACVVNCAVCDMPYHYIERPDLPRSMYSAFYEEEGNIEDILKTRSPLHLVDKLPRVPYYVFHCNKDTAVNIDMHSEKLVAAMRAAGHTVTYHIVPDRGHCSLTDEAKALFAEYVCKEIEKK